MKPQTIRNLRDMGGVRISSGRALRFGLLFRSGLLHNLDPGSVSYLKDTLRIRTIIDLRTPTEVQQLPDVVIPGVEYVHIPVFEEAVIGITKEIGIDPGKYIAKTWNHEKIRAALPDMNKIYSGALADEGVVARMAKALRIIMANAAEGRATLFHCSQGKDRTGALAALALSLCGAERRYVFEDYVKGGHAYRGKATGDFLKLLLLKFDYKAARTAYEANLARESFIASSYDTADRLYGSLENMFKDKMGLPDDAVERFREAVIV